MAALTATAWTVNIIERHREGKKRYARAALTLSGTQALTYPSSGGIPLPSRGKFGMVRQVDSVIFYEPAVRPSSIDINWKWKTTAAATSPNREMGAMLGYWAENPTAAGGPSGFVELPTTWTPSVIAVSPVFYVEVKGW